MNVIRKLKNPNNYGKNSREQNKFRRRVSDRPINRDNKFFKCRECGGHGHYQAECPTYLRRQKKCFRATLSDEKEEKEEYTNAFISSISKDDSIFDNEELDDELNENISYHKLQQKWKEDSFVCTIQKEKIQELVGESERLLTIISSLKQKLK